MKSQKSKKTMEQKKEVPEYKKKIVSDLVKLIKQHKTFLIASTRKLPSSQFHEIKKKMRENKTFITVAKKSLVLRAIEDFADASINPLKEIVQADVALFFSDLDPFALSGLLAENQSPAKAKAGDIALEDIHVEPGPTDLIPGPAISELSGVGLKVAVEGGKLAIKQPATIVKKGDKIKENVASVLGKLNILPLKVGFEPIAAFDNAEKKVYIGIRIDKKKFAEDLKEAIGKALGFSVNVKFLTKQNLSYFLAKASAEEKAISNLADKSQTTTIKEGV